MSYSKSYILYSVKLTNTIQKICVFVLAIPILCIIIGGIIGLSNGETSNFKNAFTSTSPINIGNVAVAFYNGMWSFDGWQAMTYAVEEIKDAEKVLPKAALISVPVVAFLYILINISYFTVLTPTNIVSDSAVALTFSYKILPSIAWLITLGVIFATFSTANANAFTTGRISFVAARYGHLPKVLSYVDVIQKTPFDILAKRLNILKYANQGSKISHQCHDTMC